MLERIGRSIRHPLEHINHPVEPDLWNQIRSNPVVSPILADNPRMLVIGTEPSLRFVKAILETNPGLQIIVVEARKKIVAQAKTAASYPQSVRLINKLSTQLEPVDLIDDTIYIELADLDKYKPHIAVAKYVINHAPDKTEFVRSIIAAMGGKTGYPVDPKTKSFSPNYVLFASAPFTTTKGVYSRLDLDLLDSYNIRLTTYPLVSNKVFGKGTMLQFTYPAPEFSIP
jgi:hypothetical protein